jgi:hypothetical protein
MRPTTFRADVVRNLLRQRRAATIAELKHALGTAADMTVVRKLRALGYLTSYSHAGKFYTLRELAHFDARGLFEAGEARFSRFGSLLETAGHFVTHSAAGYFTAELNEELGVETKDALRTLVRRRRVARELVEGLNLHCATDRTQRQLQLQRRREGVQPAGAATHRRAKSIDEAAKAVLLLFFATLDERQRRLYAGMESLRLGHGGDRRIAELTGLDVHTVARGRQELLVRDVELEGVRKPGGGRVAVEKKLRR